MLSLDYIKHSYYHFKILEKGVIRLIDFSSIHHVSLPVTDLEKAKMFYGNVLGLKEIKRPPFDFPGAWYEVGQQQLHLIVYEEAQTLRRIDNLDTKDGHLAIRVTNYYETLAYLKQQNVDIDTRPKSTSGFAQIFCKDPDNNLIEFNVEQSELDV